MKATIIVTTNESEINVTTTKVTMINNNQFRFTLAMQNNTIYSHNNIITHTNFYT